MKPNTLSIKQMKDEDLEAISAIERSVFPDPWSYTMFAEQLGLPQMYSLITARIDNEVVGYGGLLKIRDEGHITNLAVKPQNQSVGVGKSLVYFLFLLALKDDVKSISLEVRTTNFSAQKLYKKFGFKGIAVRKHYYGYKEDALVMAVEDIGKPSSQKRLSDIQKNLSYKIEDCLNLAS
jgi:ribosomal-protein-alanine N-acetyltransferase